MRIIGVVGWKNSGKTGLVVDLVRELRRRSLKVATVKYAHEDVVVDQPGKDSARHFEAGADESVLVAPGRWAHFGRFDDGGRGTLAAVLDRLGPVDIVLVEGDKWSAHAKLEMRRDPSLPALAAEVPNVVAVVCDFGSPEGESLPRFRRDEIAAITDFALGAASPAKALHP